MADPVLLILSGSLRKEATNRKLAHEAARLFGPAEVVEGDLNLPLYDGDVEAASGIPADVQMLADQIARADAVVISTPEYNKGPSGVLKNALDWVSRTEGTPWQDKPVAVMSAAAENSYDEAAQSLERVEQLVSLIPDMETLKEAVDHNTRVTAELAIAMTRMWELEAIQTVGAGQSGVVDAATLAEERRYMDFTLPDLRAD